MMTDSFSVFELEILDSRGQRSWEAEQVWKTAHQKRNRIALGVPRWRPAGHGWKLGLDLTLLPDEGCRFTSAELSITFRGDGREDALPVVTALEPAVLKAHELVVTERSGSLQAKLELPIAAGPGLESEASRKRRTEVTRTLIGLGSFGVGTAAAGWRFRLTEAQEIPISTTGLKARIENEPAFRGTVSYSVVAAIEISGVWDRWVTAAFIPKPGAVSATEPFPPVAG